MSNTRISLSESCYFVKVQGENTIVYNCSVITKQESKELIVQELLSIINDINSSNTQLVKLNSFYKEK